MRLFRRLVYWWRFDPQVSWKWLSTLSQIPNDQMRAGSARATGVSDRLVTTASRNGVRVTVIALSRGND